MSLRWRSEDAVVVKRNPPPLGLPTWPNRFQSTL